MINIAKIKTVKIGKQGENLASQLQFDITPFIAAYGAGSVQLLHQRSGDDVPYIAKITQDGNTATWNLTNDDTAINGYGRAQLNYYVGNVLAKSVVFTTVCDNSLTDETGTPTKVKSDLALIAETVENKLSPDNVIGGENVTVEIDGMNVIINSQGGGVKEYKDLLGLPRTLYTPSSDTVNITAINNGIYDVADAFTLTSDGQTVYVEKGAILAVNRNNNDVYALFVNSAEESGVLKKTADGSTGFAFIDLLRYNFADFVTSSELTAEENARQNADNDLQGQIDAITVSSDVIDIVGTYAELQAYDTQHVKANDIIKVMQDSTHGDATSYYRWVITENVGAWVYVGSEGPYYTKSETNALLQEKLDASAVKQTTGSSTTDVMSQKAVTDALPACYKAASSLPTANIDDTARYLIKNNKLFPSAAGLIDNTYNTIVVKHDELHDEWKLLRSTGIWYYFSSYTPLSFTYEIYTLNTAGTEWVIETPETTDSNWSVAMGFGAKLSQFDATGILFSTHDIGTALQGIEDFRYRTTSNVADIYGASTSGEPVYTFLTWKHSTDGWTMLGVTDLTDILKPIDDAINDESTARQTADTTLTAAVNGKQPKNLYFQNVAIAAADWTGNTFAVETFTGDGTTTAFTLQGTVVSGTPTVKVNDTEATDFTYENGVITFTTAPADGDEIEVTYNITPDVGFERYPYKSVITAQGVTANSPSHVYYNDAQAASGAYSSLSSGADTLTVYSFLNTSITIPLISVEVVS